MMNNIKQNDTPVTSTNTIKEGKHQNDLLVMRINLHLLKKYQYYSRKIIITTNISHLCQQNVLIENDQIPKHRLCRHQNKQLVPTEPVY